MSLMERYEKCKQKLADAEKERVVLEDRRMRLIEQLKSTYQLTMETARDELLRLKEEIAVLERDFDEKYKSFEEKWNQIL